MNGHQYDVAQGPAFPTDTHGIESFGLTKRDWFAGQALTGITAALGAHHDTPASAAKDAYRFADAMLVERLK